MLADKEVAAKRREVVLAAMRKGKRPANPAPDVVQPAAVPRGDVAPAVLEPQTELIIRENAPAAAASIDEPEAPVLTRRRLSLPLVTTDKVMFRAQEELIAAPHLLKMLLSTVLATNVRAPICIVLPSAERVPETVAILAALECLAADLHETRAAFIEGLVAGTKVRLYPGGEVFEIAAVLPDKSLRLLMMDKGTYASNGTRFATGEHAFWFEPTTRHLPLGTQFTKFAKAPPNGLDLIVGSQVFGNSGLVRTRVLMAGARAEFERTLEALPIISRETANVVPVRNVFQFGGVDDGGEPYVVEPSGSAGHPMVAIERDMLDLERACLAPRVEAGSRVVITDRIDMLMRDLDLAGRIAERQRLVVFAEARRRSEVEPLAARGWTVWEPAAHEILGPVGTNTGRIGCEGIDASVRGAAAELLRSPGFVSCKAPALKQADAALAILGEHLGDESVEHEPWVEELLDTAQGLFFAAAGWLAAPDGEALEATLIAIERVRRAADRVERHLGAGAAVTVLELTDAIEAFRNLTSPGAVTAKGEQVLRLARTASETSFRQVFVTGNRQSREEADAFFQHQGLPTRCVAVRDLRGVGDASSVVAFSVMRRNLFERLVDPWPSGSTLFVGYDFENDCHRRRLARRHASRLRLQLSETGRSILTGFPGTSFPAAAAAPSADVVDPADGIRLDAFDRATREWNWTRRIAIPAPRQGEESCKARIVKFSGRSWCAMTEEHDVILFARDAKGGWSVRDAHINELAQGERIIIREGGDRDVIRLLAENHKGAEGYAALRERAALWRRAMISASDDATIVRRKLEAIGVRRNPVTIRAWLKNEALIGPRSQDDLQAIAKAFPTTGARQADWQACGEAIRELRALHIWAGSHLTDILAARCGKMLFEPSDTELAIDLGVGTVWVLEVASIEEQARECPASYVNRLQWLDPSWRARLLSTPLRDMAA